MTRICTQQDFSWAASYGSIHYITLQFITLLTEHSQTHTLRENLVKQKVSAVREHLLVRFCAFVTVQWIHDKWAWRNSYPPTSHNLLLHADADRIRQNIRDWARWYLCVGCVWRIDTSDGHVAAHEQCAVVGKRGWGRRGQLTCWIALLPKSIKLSLARWRVNEHRRRYSSGRTSQGTSVNDWIIARVSRRHRDVTAGLNDIGIWRRYGCGDRCYSIW